MNELEQATEIVKKRKRPDFKGLSLEELRDKYNEMTETLREDYKFPFEEIPFASIAEGEEACKAADAAVRKAMRLEHDRAYQKRKREEAAKAKAETPPATEPETEDTEMSRKKAARKTSKARTSTASAKSHQKITVVAKENPKRPNTEQHRRFAQLMRFHGKTVEDFKNAGGLQVTLTHAVDIGTVKVS